MCVASRKSAGSQKTGVGGWGPKALQGNQREGRAEPLNFRRAKVRWGKVAKRGMGSLYQKIPTEHGNDQEYDKVGTPPISQ